MQGLGEVFRQGLQPIPSFLPAEARLPAQVLEQGVLPRIVALVAGADEVRLGVVGSPVRHRYPMLDARDVSPVDWMALAHLPSRMRGKGYREEPRERLECLEFDRTSSAVPADVAVSHQNAAAVAG